MASVSRKLLYLNERFNVIFLTYNLFIKRIIKVRKKARIRNRYNQVPHLTQDIGSDKNTSHLDILRQSLGQS